MKNKGCEKCLFYKYGLKKGVIFSDYHDYGCAKLPFCSKKYNPISGKMDRYLGDSKYFNSEGECRYYKEFKNKSLIDKLKKFITGGQQ